MAEQTSEFTFSHIGVCVSDLERSLRFYCEGLGFERVSTFGLGDAYATALEVAGGRVDGQSVFLRLGRTNVELLAYAVPAPAGAPSASRAQLGVTHLSFRVQDVDAMAKRLEALGGKVLSATRGVTPQGTDLVFVADPDGVRVELMRLPER